MLTEEHYINDPAISLKDPESRQSGTHLPTCRITVFSSCFTLILTLLLPDLMACSTVGRVGLLVTILAHGYWLLATG